MRIGILYSGTYFRNWSRERADRGCFSLVGGCCWRTKGARTSFATARAAVAQRLAAQQCLAKKVRSLAQHQSGQDVRAPVMISSHLIHR